jgi:uncharacterized protein (UPF0548 family)
MRFVRPSDSTGMHRLVESFHRAQPTYSDVGATLEGVLPEGFHHDRYEVVLGRGSTTFHIAVKGLKTWKAHDMPGVRIFPEGREIQSGATVVATLGTPFVALAAPCRIVRVIDDETRWGFAYGTLPGHPEQGEESFVVSISSDGIVRFEIVAFSRPGDALVRLSGPLGRSIQKGGSRGYLQALRRYVEKVQMDR